MGRSTSSSSSFETEAIIGKETTTTTTKKKKKKTPPLWTTTRGRGEEDDDDDESDETSGGRDDWRGDAGVVVLLFSGCNLLHPLATVVAGEAEEAKESMMEPRVQKYFASGPFAVRELPTVKHVLGGLPFVHRHRRVKSR